MSLRSMTLGLLVLAAGCGGSSNSEEPKTAAEKQRLDAEASGSLDTPKGGRSAWRYTGDRDNCFFVVGRRCFKTEEAACTAAKCGKASCDVTGAGPARVACAK